MARSESLSLECESEEDMAAEDKHRFLLSGQFMCSRLDENNEDDSNGDERDRKPFNFSGAKKETTNSYKFGGKTARKNNIWAIDSSLTKLFECMSLAYSGKLTSPKFKNFKGLKLTLKDKLRLNNIIWREWHMQYKAGGRPVVCQFSTPGWDEAHTKPEAVVLEGKYWKRRLETVSQEYKKWRVFFKEHLAKDHNDKDLEEVISHAELLDRVAQQDTFRLVQQPPSSNPLFTEEELSMDLADTLFSSLNQPFAFPSFNAREMLQLNADCIQPGLVQLQPSLDSFMDTLEPLQDLLTSSKGDPYPVLPNGTLDQSYYLSTSSPQFLHAAPNIVQSPMLINTQGQQLYMTDGQDLDMAMTVPLPTYTSTAANGITGSRFSQVQCLLTSSSVPSDAKKSRSISRAVVTPVRPERFAVPKVKQGRRPRPIVPAPKTTNTSDTSSTQNTYLAHMLTTGSLPGSEKGEGQPLKPIRPVVASNNMNSNLATLANTATLVDIHTGPALFPVGTVITTNHSTKVTTLANAPVAVDLTNASPMLSIIQPKLEDDRHHYKDRRASHISAEHKRRCNIKSGFDLLYMLIPSLMQNPNAKISKAGMLQKTAEYCKKLKVQRNQMQEEADILKQEIEALNSAISISQQQLPATGAPVARQNTDHVKQMFEDYVKTQTLTNWKFYIFSIIIRSLFETYNGMISTASLDELTRTVTAWLDQHCSLVTLRPIVLNALRHLSTSTSILSNPAKLSEEALDAIDKS